MESELTEPADQNDDRVWNGERWRINEMDETLSN